MCLIGSQRRICSSAVDHIDILKRDGVNATIERFKKDVSFVSAKLPSKDEWLGFVM